MEEVLDFMVKVLSINRFLGVGVTHPYVAQLEKDGEVFIGFIKLKNNPEGTLCLINELICYRLAKKLEILMPESGVAVIDEKTTDNTGEGLMKLESLGHCFYSRRLEMAVPLNQKTMNLIDNKDAYEKIIVFDHIIFNKDRNAGNVLLSAKKREKVLYIIDHTHVFKNEAIWDSNCLRQGIKDNDYLSEEILSSCNGETYYLFAQDKPISLNSLTLVAEKFKQLCSSSIIDDIVKDIPVDWPINDEMVEALKDYLLYRLDHINEICSMIVKNRRWKNE